MHKILLIEDQREIRENLQEYMELSDFEVLTAIDGKEGLELLAQTIPDLIICDISMPILDGYEVLQLVRSNPITKHIPFVFLSASAQERDIAKGKAAGCQGYFTKPISTEALIIGIQKILKNHKQ